MSTIVKLATLACLSFTLLGNSLATVENLSQEELEKIFPGAYQVYGGGHVFSGEENKTAIGDVLTGAGMGALMIVKSSVLALKTLGLFRGTDLDRDVIVYEKKIRNQYSATYQTKRYKHEHSY